MKNIFNKKFDKKEQELIIHKLLIVMTVHVLLFIIITLIIF